MKVKVEIKYPSWTIYKSEEEIDVPDGVDVDEWIYNHEQEIIENKSMEPLKSSAIDAGYAGVRRIP